MMFPCPAAVLYITKLSLVFSPSLHALFSPLLKHFGRSKRVHSHFLSCPYAIHILPLDLFLLVSLFHIICHLQTCNNGSG